MTYLALIDLCFPCLFQQPTRDTFSLVTKSFTVDKILFFIFVLQINLNLVCNKYLFYRVATETFKLNSLIFGPEFMEFFSRFP